MIILTDTREKTPWDFSFFKAKQKFTYVKAGDYTIAGLENIIMIERKKTVFELINNLVRQGDRFAREFQRCKAERKIIICEFPREHIYNFESTWIYKKRKMKVTAAYFTSQLAIFLEEQNAEIFYNENRAAAQTLAYQLLDETFKQHQCGPSVI